MMLIGNVDIIGRYVFNKPVYGAVDIQEFIMVLVVFLGMAYTQVVKGHVSVDVVIARFSPHARAILNAATCFLSAGAWALVGWQLGMRAWEKLFSPIPLLSLVLQATLLPFIFAAAVGSLILCLVLLIDVSRYVSQASGNRRLDA